MNSSGLPGFADPQPSRTEIFERNTRIDDIVAEFLQDCDAGRPVDRALLCRLHPELMPDLGRRLTQMCALDTVARDVRPKRGPVGVDEGTEGSLDEELAYLGHALSQFDVLERLHSGGQGVVYKAVQKSTGRVVAIKVLLYGPLATPRQRQRFEREISLISRLQHPHIVTVYESGVVWQGHYFAMEWVDGLPLDDCLALGRLPVRDRVRLFTTVCRAVHHAHQMGVIHRDLKPANILVDLGGQPHVLDFGLGKDLSGLVEQRESTRATRTGQVFGTLPYLSPEQAGGADREIDERCDIYSLGVVFFKGLTGSVPFPHEDDPAAMRAHILLREPGRLRKAIVPDSLGAPPDPAAINDDLEAVFQKALARDPARRYPSAEAFARDLERYLAGEAVEARAGQRVYRVRKALARHRAHLLVAAGLTALLAASITTAAVWYRAQDAARLYQAGLQMGSFNKLGSVERDAGRIDQAVAMLEKSVEIGESAEHADPTVQRYLYGAYDRLANLYYEEDQPELADRYCTAAVHLAEQRVQENPQDAEWQRLLGFAHVLRGRMAMSRKDWPGALEAFNQAASIRQALVVRDPVSVAHKGDLAAVRGFQGQCMRQLQRHEESLKHYQAAYRLYEEVLGSAPRSWARIIDLAESANALAAWHMSQRTSEHDRGALQWLQRARQILNDPANPDEPGDQRWWLDTMLRAISTNEAIIAKRTATSTQNPD